MAINLLPKQLQDQQELKKTQFYVNVGTITILSVLLMAVVGMYIYRLTVSQQQAQVQEQLGSLRNQVADQRVIEGTLKAVELKLSKIREVINKSYPYGEIMEDLEVRSGERIELEEVDIKSQDQFSVTGNTDSLTTLAEFLSVIKLDVSTGYENVRVTNMRFSKDDFRFKFTFLFNYVPPVATTAGGEQ